MTPRFYFFHSLNIFLATGLTLVLLPFTVRNAQARSFVQQLIADAHLHPQKHVEPNPVLPDGQSVEAVRALTRFRPGADSKLIANSSNAYGSVAPFATADDLSSKQAKRADTGSIRLSRRSDTNTTTSKTLLTRKTRATLRTPNGKQDIYHEHEFGPKYAKCSFVDNVIRSDNADPVIRGVVLLQQADAQAPIKITGTVHGLQAGVHGFHVFEFGDVSDFCFGVGRHYNPFNTTHGAPYDKKRHVGDLGNIITDAKGTAHVDKIDKVVTLFGRYSVEGRAIVIHANADDFGRGGSELSLMMGNAGPFVACCTIGKAMEGTLAEKPSGQRPRGRILLGSRSII